MFNIFKKKEKQSIRINTSIGTRDNSNINHLKFLNTEGIGVVHVPEVKYTFPGAPPKILGKADKIEVNKESSIELNYQRMWFELLDKFKDDMDLISLMTRIQMHEYYRHGTPEIIIKNFNGQGIKRVSI